MTSLKIAVILGALIAPIVSIASTEEVRSAKTAEFVCYTNKDCVKLVSLQLDSMYNEGLNERDPVTLGTLINRKSKNLSHFCEGSKDKAVCENYKNQLMLKYITGLLDR